MMPLPLQLQVLHDTRYDYASPVAIAQHLAWLHPLATPWQRVDDFRLEIDPSPSLLRAGTDHFGNLRHTFALYQPHDRLQVRARTQVTLLPRAAPDLEASGSWQVLRQALAYRAGAACNPAVEFVFASPRIPLLPELRDYAQACFGRDSSVLQGASRLMQRIHADFSYQPSATEVSTPIQQAFRQRAGVCQDFAQIMIGCLRALGLPARYVSGYLLTQPPPGEERLVGADASHAWVSVFCPVHGWVDFDPTNNLQPQLSHVTLATGRDFTDVIPLRGVLQGGATHQLRVAVTVTALS